LKRLIWVIGNWVLTVIKPLSERGDAKGGGKQRAAFRKLLDLKVATCGEEKKKGQKSP